MEQAVSQPAAGTEMDIELRRRAAALRTATAAFGEIASILMRSPNHAHYRLPDLEWLIMPALLNRQFSLIHVRPDAKAVPVPAGLVMWASVSPEIDARIMAGLGQPMRLTAAERRSGSIHWITDTAGDAKLLGTAMQRLRTTTFNGARIKMISRAPDGGLVVVEK